MLDRRDSIAQPHRNTCKWVLDLREYQTWRESASGMLWIKGKPGCGKSTLMSFLYRMFREEREGERTVCLDFFFTARGTELQHSLVGMLRSLLVQLLGQHPAVSRTLEASYKEKFRSHGTGVRSWVWQQAELERLLSEAVITLCRHKQVMVFIDALDEAGGNVAQHIMQYFHDINDCAATANKDVGGSNLKFCISSRHYPTVSAVRAVEIVVEEHNGQDIQDYVEHRLRTDTLKIHVLEISTWQKLTSGILERANGMFQWVCLVVPMLLQRLEEGWLLEDTNDFLQSLPKDLEDIYMRIVQNHLDRRKMPESLLLFQWVCYSKRQLSLIEMMYALTSHRPHVCLSLQSRLDENTMRKRIKSLSGGLVEVSRGNSKSAGVVQVVHQTVREFLVKGGLELLIRLAAGHRVSPTTENICSAEDVVSQCNATLYQCCLHYLDSLDSQSFSSIEEESLVLLESIGDPRDHAAYTHINSRLPFFLYAAFNVFLHAEEASSFFCKRGGRQLNETEEFKRLKCVRAKWNLRCRFFEDDMFINPRIDWSLCHIAAFLGLIEIMRCLVHDGCPVDVQDELGQTPLHYASRKGHRAIGEILIRAEADVNSLTASGFSPLAYAARGSHTKFVALLLENGANVNCITTDGDSCLIFACQNGNVRLARQLLAAGADVNIPGYSRSALEFAVSSGILELVKILLDAGADANAQCGDYETVLSQAAFYGQHEIMDMLLDAGADINARGGNYGTALIKAICFRKRDVVAMLLSAGADVNVEGCRYGTPLLAAVQNNDDDLVRVLLDAGADASAQDSEYGSVLHAAVQYSERRHARTQSSRAPITDEDFRARAKIVKELLNAGAKVNAHGDGCSTAIWAAVRQGHRRFVKMLLDAGADVHIQDDEARSACSIAAEDDQLDILVMLHRAGVDMGELASAVLPHLNRLKRLSGIV